MEVSSTPPAAAVKQSYVNPEMVIREATPTQKGAEAVVSKWLNRLIRVTLPDDRTLIGVAICIDGGGNLILHEAVEKIEKKIKKASGEEQTVTRTNHHRSVIIPGRQIAKIEIEKSKPVEEKPREPQEEQEQQQHELKPTSAELD
eukprot:TRINITY_DN1555_c1_g1_i1.p2 TRINITY_DN1555_c1_g1~~TRINITY_DN1555_c1_g1_i1.p2  ORF type:complete len:158 (+),score=39.02 TRINITY_DN1555_c1_g1_i1:41-475(+)